MHAGEQFHGGCFAATLEAGDGMAITKFSESLVRSPTVGVRSAAGSDGLHWMNPCKLGLELSVTRPAGCGRCRDHPLRPR